MPKFQRRQYTVIAELIRQLCTDEALPLLAPDARMIAEAFAVRFMADNPRFDRKRLQRLRHLCDVAISLLAIGQKVRML